MHRPIQSTKLVLVLVTVSICTPGVARAQRNAQPKPNPPSIDRLASEMKRVAPKSPAGSLAQIEVAEGFKAELVASEPLVRDPVALDFDEQGRMFVVQLPQYNGYAVEGFNRRGSIAMLVDTDGDGRYDTSIEYADDLNYPTAVACWDGGLFVGVAPDLIYLKDTDGDGKADVRRVVFSGFGSDKAGEGHLNSFRWGADNRFHISTNISGGDVRATADDSGPAVSVRGRGLIFDPRDLSGFELTSGGGQHGMSMDEWGRKFVCSNSVPAQMLMFDDRYLARNPRLESPAPAVDIAPEGKFTQLYRISANEPWRVLRTRLRKDGLFRGSDEGGKPFGFFTGATGITVYRGDAWPEAYRGSLLVGDVANNLIYRATLDPAGVRVVARRAHPGREFLASRDIWFRPVQFANAPDGSLFVLDIYRELIEGAAFLPPEFLKYLDPVGGNDRGRIYRIVPRGFEQPKRPNLGTATTEELVALLEHTNGWHRDTASRLLYQRQDRSAVKPLRQLATDAELPEGRVMALYSLDGVSALDEPTLLSALNDRTPLVRTHALRLADRRVAGSVAIAAQLMQMVEDEDLRVRYQLAFSLGGARGPQRNRALASLAKRDGSDSWLQLAILSSLYDGAGPVFAMLGEDPSFRQTGHGRDLLLKLSRQIASSGRTDELSSVLSVLDKLTMDEAAFSAELVKALVESSRDTARERILAAADGKVNDILSELLEEAAIVSVDDSKPTSERVEAIGSLRLSRFDKTHELFAELLDLQQTAEIQIAALDVLAEFDSREVATLILDAWPTFSPSVRSRATETLLSRPSWVTDLMDAVEEGGVRRGDIDPARVELLKRHPDEQLAKRVAKLFDRALLPQRQDVVQRYQPALEADGDATRGKHVFKKVCSACHQLEGVGTAVGADLKGIRNRGLAAVLLNILDPNREVKPQFLTYVMATDEGRVITGMIVNESANTLIVQQLDGTRVNVQRNQIEQLRSTGLSFMPEGLEKQIQVQDMADLLSYLDSIQ